MKRRSSTFLVTITDMDVKWAHPAASQWLAEDMQKALGVQSVIARVIGPPHAARDMRSVRALPMTEVLQTSEADGIPLIGTLVIR